MNTTKSKGKFLVYLEKFIESDYCQTEIKKLRHELGIPINGYVLTEEELELFKNKGAFHLPKEAGLRPENRSPFDRKINITVREIGKRSEINTYFAQLLIKGFVFYNKFLGEELISTDLMGDADLCKIYDSVEEFKEYGGDDPELYENYLDVIEHNNNIFPIAIKVHPQASQRDVVDFIKKHWPMIEYIQSKYSNDKTSLKNARKLKDDIKARNKFIYENRHLKIKQIRKLLAEKGIFIDDGLIGKIISLEVKRRKEV